MAEAPGHLGASQQLPGRPAGGVVAVLQADPDLDVGMRASGRDQPVGLGHGGRDRLLQQHRHPGLETVDRHGDVLVVRRADVHHVRPYGFQKLTVIGERGHGEMARALRDGITDPGQLDAGQLPDRRQVDDRDVTAPDHGGPDGHFTPPAVSPPTRYRWNTR